MEITTVHGKTVTVVPGRTVVEYRNGFCNDVRIFPSTQARDSHLSIKRDAARSYMATSYSYSAR